MEGTLTLRKPFEIEFKLDAKILATLYICWKFKLPISYFITFYEQFEEWTLFIFKAMICSKKLALNDNALANIVEESKKLHLQIVKGISTNIKIKQLEALTKAGKLIDEDIPERPEINLYEFSDDYREFIEKYLFKNIKNLFSENVILKLGTRELYCHA